MGDVLEELSFRALNLATASHDRAERGDFGARSVHATRAGAKRLRALWQLLRPAIDAGVADDANVRLRDSNRLLAPARDAHVARKTTSKLLAKCARGKDRKALRAFRDTLPADSKRTPALVNVLGLAAVYREELAAWRSLAIDASDQAVIYSGMRRAYGKGQRLARKAIASGGPSSYHRWRKWVKYLLYQLEALDPRLLGWQRDYALLLDRLGDALGKYNDLQNLREQALSSDLSRPTRRRVSALVDERARRIRRRCQKLHVDVYRARPEIFAASIARAVAAPERIAVSLVNIAGE